MLKLLLSLRLAVLAGGIVVALAAPGRAQNPGGSERANPGHGLLCGFDSVQQAAFRRQPGAEEQYRQFLRQATELSANAQARMQTSPDVTVPVVVHVIHTGGASNISDAQVHDALRLLNEDFSKRNADTASIIPAFQSRVANVGFQFRLAQLDPNGNCTTGITRTYSTLTNVGDNQVKSLIVWNQSRYLNIWVCASAGAGLAYATGPCWGGPNDGIVIRNDHLSSIGTSVGTNKALRALTHEVGHYFGVPHTWGIGNAAVGLASNCSIDDGIADTPNTIGINNNCNLAFSPCTDANGQPILANVQNYMDYSGCLSMFTTGQRAVMRASLQLGCRSQLTTAANLLATGTNDGFAGGPCAPVVAFEASTSKICEGGAVTFQDYSYNDAPGAARAYSWTFSGGTPASSTLANPTVTYPTPGLHGATLTVTSTPGGSTTRTQLVQVTGANTGLAGPVAESFENPGFPNNFAGNDLRNWSVTATSPGALGAAWVQANPPGGGLVASHGGACLWVRSNLLPANTITWLTSPNINLSAYSAANPPVLTFDRAYAQRTTPVNENLQVQFSADCGNTWATAVAYSSADLNTMGTLGTNSFVPTAAADWQSLHVPVPPAFVGPLFQVRFQLVSQQGNALYLDHVRLSLPTATGTATAQAARYGLRLFPNPATAETTVELTLPVASTVQVCLTDLLGRQVLARPSARLAAGRQTVALPQAAQLAPGLYLVQVRTGGQTLITKLLVR